MKTHGVDICKNGLWHVNATRLVELGLWGRCVSYARENCVLYARSCGSVAEHCVSMQRLWVQFPGNTHTDKTCITWMHCKSLWIKVSDKCKYARQTCSYHIYMPKSIFVYINTTRFIFIWRTIYMHFSETGLLNGYILSQFLVKWDAFLISDSREWLSFQHIKICDSSMGNG